MLLVLAASDRWGTWLGVTQHQPFRKPAKPTMKSHQPEVLRAAALEGLEGSEPFPPGHRDAEGCSCLVGASGSNCDPETWH